MSRYSQEVRDCLRSAKAPSTGADADPDGGSTGRSDLSSQCDTDKSLQSIKEASCGPVALSSPPPPLAQLLPDAVLQTAVTRLPLLVHQLDVLLSEMCRLLHDEFAAREGGAPLPEGLLFDEQRYDAWLVGAREAADARQAASRGVDESQGGEGSGQVCWTESALDDFDERRYAVHGYSRELARLRTEVPKLEAEVKMLRGSSPTTLDAAWLAPPAPEPSPFAVVVDHVIATRGDVLLEFASPPQSMPTEMTAMGFTSRPTVIISRFRVSSHTLAGSSPYFARLFSPGYQCGQADSQQDHSLSSHGHVHDDDDNFDFFPIDDDDPTEHPAFVGRLPSSPPRTITLSDGTGAKVSVYRMPDLLAAAPGPGYREPSLGSNMGFHPLDDDNDQEDDDDAGVDDSEYGDSGEHVRPGRRGRRRRRSPYLQFVALTVLLRAAHHASPNLIPRRISFPLFVAISVACLRFRLTSPLELVVEHVWMPAHMHRVRRDPWTAGAVGGVIGGGGGSGPGTASFGGYGDSASSPGGIAESILGLWRDADGAGGGRRGGSGNSSGGSGISRSGISYTDRGMVLVCFVWGMRRLFTRTSKTAVLGLDMSSSAEDDNDDVPWPRRVRERIFRLRNAKVAQVVRCCRDALAEYLPDAVAAASIPTPNHHHRSIAMESLAPLRSQTSTSRHERKRSTDTVASPDKWPLPVLLRPVPAFSTGRSQQQPQQQKTSATGGGRRTHSWSSAAHSVAEHRRGPSPSTVTPVNAKDTSSPSSIIGQARALLRARCPRGSHACDAANLGWLMLVLNTLGLLPYAMPPSVTALPKTGTTTAATTSSSRPPREAYDDEALPPVPLSRLVDALHRIPSSPAAAGTATSSALHQHPAGGTVGGVRAAATAAVCDPAPALRRAVSDVYNSVTGLTLYEVSGTMNSGRTKNRAGGGGTAVHGWALSRAKRHEEQRILRMVPVGGGAGMIELDAAMDAADEDDPVPARQRDTGAVEGLQLVQQNDLAGTRSQGIPRYAELDAGRGDSILENKKTAVAGARGRQTLPPSPGSLDRLDDDLRLRISRMIDGIEDARALEQADRGFYATFTRHATSLRSLFGHVDVSGGGTGSTSTSLPVWSRDDNGKQPRGPVAATATGSGPRENDNNATEDSAASGRAAITLPSSTIAAAASSSRGGSPSPTIPADEDPSTTKYLLSDFFVTTTTTATVTATAAYSSPKTLLRPDQKQLREDHDRRRLGLDVPGPAAGRPLQPVVTIAVAVGDGGSGAGGGGQSRRGSRQSSSTGSGGWV